MKEAAPVLEMDDELLKLIEKVVSNSEDPIVLAGSVDELKAKLCSMGHKQYCKDIIVA